MENSLHPVLEKRISTQIFSWRKSEANPISSHSGKALYDLAVLNDMKMTVLDDRKELLTEERFPLAERHIDNYENLLIREYPAVSPYYVIFTHGHEYDTACLEYALKHKASYIGMIGSKKKTERTFCLLREKGFSEDDIRRVHAPIGLAIGAETPEEIAISIMAEIISAFRSEKNVSVFDADLLRILAETEEGIVIRIIDKHGSAPRERGSMMLVTEKGSYGTIGGGAIEKDAAETAIKMLRENKKHLHQNFPRPFSIFSPVIGHERTHTPVASAIAIAIAGAAPLQAISDIDLAPNGPNLSFMSISSARKSSGASLIIGTP